ncbi:glycerol kinase-like [Eurosta solidaginis]|uniref:glycerol kinase-like n=1 Tax=Eurosta solidaginis TaxID=178769 RepID=UPI0035310833
MISSSCSSGILNAEFGLTAMRSEIRFVPAFRELYSPYWRYDTRGVLLGLTGQTTAENVTQAAYNQPDFKSMSCYAVRRDTPTWHRQNNKERLIFCGEYAKKNAFVQCIADIIYFGGTSIYYN